MGLSLCLSPDLNIGVMQWVHLSDGKSRHDLIYSGKANDGEVSVSGAAQCFKMSGQILSIPGALLHTREARTVYTSYLSNTPSVYLP